MKRNIFVIGASAGGVEAIPRLLSSLPAKIPASIFVTLHLSPYCKSIFPTLVSQRGHLPAEHARDGERIRTGRIYIAPPDSHLMLEPSRVRLGHGARENRHRPAIDPLFRSAAEAFGGRVVGILLTGNLDDGVAGLKCIQECGGLTIVQDPDEASYPEMPRNALSMAEPDFCLKIEDIEQLVSHLAIQGEPPPGMKIRKLSTRIRQRPVSCNPEPTGEPIPLACPDCQGPLWGNPRRAPAPLPLPGRPPI